MEAEGAEPVVLRLVSLLDYLLLLVSGYFRLEVSLSNLKSY